MSYLIGQIICCLILAAILGFIVGWLLRGLLMRGKIARLEDECKQKLDQQRVDLAAGSQGAAGDYSASSNPDDLILIKGIGPVLEKRLNELGVYTFKQIAEWTDADIEAISEKMGPFPNRIVDEKWVQQAKALQKQKYGR